MKNENSEIVEGALAYRLIGLAMQVHRELGYGFLEKVYENSLMVLCQREGIRAMQQVPLKVKFQGVIVGDYFADLLIDDRVIVELKAGDGIVPAHRAQMLNYLKTTGLELGLILNFGKKNLEHERLVRTQSPDVRDSQ